MNDPIRIVDILYKGRPVQSGLPFDGDEEWLKDVSVEIQNVSAKTLTHASVQIVFPSLGKPAVFNFAAIGQFPEHRRRRNGTLTPDSAQPISVTPGAMSVIPFQPALSAIKTILTGKADLSDIHTCTIGLNQAYLNG